jgi:predicted dehydrogenase
MSGGVRYTYRGSWCNEGMHTSWEADWRIAGSKGTILWDGGKNIRGQMHKPGAPATGFFREMVEVPVQTVAMEHLHHAAQIRDYVDCLKTGRRPMTHGEDNIRSLAMVMAAVKSRKLGQKVAVEW